MADDYIPLGSESKLYYNTGTHASPTWAEASNVQDMEVGPIGPDMISLDIRAMGKRKAYTPGQTDERIKGKLVWRKDSDHELYGDVQALLDAGRGGTSLELLALDGPRTEDGNEGLRMTCLIKLGARTENLGEFLSLDFEAFQAVSANPTEWVQVVSSALTAV